MVKLIYIEHDGTRHPVEVEEGMNLMEGATLNSVPGVDGMCGGLCSCATCHCYLPEDRIATVAPAAEGEAALLDFVPERRPGSRLGCQVRVTRELDGAEIGLPSMQANAA